MDKRTLKVALSAMIMAIGLLLPSILHMFGTGLGTLISPLHLPGFIGGLLLGPVYGGIIGLLVPLLSSFVNSMPMLVPFGIIMMFEVAAYAIISGYLYKKKHLNIYLALVAAMLGGRIVGGLFTTVIFGFMERSYGLSMFFTAYFVNTLPAMIIQIVLVPVLIKLLERVLPNV